MSAYEDVCTMTLNSGVRERLVLDWNEGGWYG